MIQRQVLIFLSLYFAFTNLIIAQPVSYPIDAAHSVISFSVGFAGGITSIEGRFDSFKGSIGYSDMTDKLTLEGDLRIDVSSINTGDKYRDKDLLAPAFFNVEEFPDITFSEVSVSKTSQDFVLTGSFTLLGKTSVIKIPMTFRHESPIIWVFGEPRIAIEGTYAIDRLTYGIPKKGWNQIVPSLGSMALSKDVEIKLVIQGVGPSLSARVLQIIDANGVTAGIELYSNLEEEAEEDTYAFGERTLLGIVMQLAAEDKAQEAISFGKYATERHSDSFMSWYGLALAYEATGDKVKAIQYYEKTLTLNPEFSRAKSAMEELKE